MISSTDASTARRIRSSTVEKWPDSSLNSKRLGRIIAVDFAFDGGTSRDPADRAGSAYLVSGLLDEGKYTFIVDPRANKTEIKIAVEQIFDVKVDSVHTMNRVGKARRTRFGTGKRKDTKRAIVTLREGTIDIFGGQG